jgi:hypothetical protein
VIDEQVTFSFAPGEFHATTVEGGLCAGGDHCCFGDPNAGVLGKCLTLLLFACVDSKWEGKFYAGDKFSHVVVNVRLGNHSIGAANLSYEVAKGDCVETFGGVIEFLIIHIINGRHKLVLCDCADDDVCVPCLVLFKVGSSSGLMHRSSSGWIDGIVRRRRIRNCV